MALGLDVAPGKPDVLQDRIGQCGKSAALASALKRSGQAEPKADKHRTVDLAGRIAVALTGWMGEHLRDLFGMPRGEDAAPWPTHIPVSATDVSAGAEGFQG